MALSRHKPILWIAAGILLSLPLLVLLAFSVAFKLNDLRPDQLEPPKGLIHIGPPPAVPPFDFKKLPCAYGVLLASGPNQQFAAAHTRLEGQNVGLKYCVDLQRWESEPFSPEQDSWLVLNRTVVNDILTFSKLSKGIVIPCEAVFPLDAKTAAGVPVINVIDYHTYARILVIEARHRMRRDPNGAAEAVMAIHAIAHSISEPWLLSYMTCLNMQTTADMQIARWLGEGCLSPDLARRMRDQLAPQAMTNAHYRRVLELEYKNMRTHLVNFVSLPFGQLLGLFVTGSDTSCAKMMASRLRSDPAGALQALAVGTRDSLDLKLKASSVIEELDSAYVKALNAIDRNEGVSVDKVSFVGRNMLPNFNEPLARTNANLALLRCDLAGLDIVAGGPGNQIDPFTNKPLIKVDETTSTLIYSIGPDKTDQRAKVTYDPANSTFSEGDIWVRVKKR